MFFIKKILLVVLIFILVGTYIKTETKEQIIIPDTSLRFRVISNSNSIEDYKIKMEVKKEVEEKLNKLLENAQNIEETKEIIEGNLQKIDEEVLSILAPKNIDYKIDFGSNYFPEKIFKGVIYQEGKYDSLVVTIGSGQGENWWCVLFPPLCLLEENETTSDVEYQFYVSRIINYFK